MTINQRTSSIDILLNDDSPPGRTVTSSLFSELISTARTTPSRYFMVAGYYKNNFSTFLMFVFSEFILIFTD